MRIATNHRSAPSLRTGISVNLIGQRPSTGEQGTENGERGMKRGQGISLLVERHLACEVAGQGSQRTPPRSSRAGRDPGCFREDRPHSFQD